MSTYVPIQAITLSAATATVTFTGIPQTYTDLVLVANGRSTGTSGTSEAMNLRINSDSSSLYSVTRLSGTGSSAFSNRGSNATATEVSRLSPSTGSYNAFDATIIQFLNYASTLVNKTILCRGNSMNEDVPVTATVSLYRSTNAVTSVTLFPAVAANFASGSTFTLYGIGSGSPKAFGGDRVVTDGTYWYHAFLSSGRFEPVQNLSCDVLVVAGGGGGGSWTGGGGGAGGLLAHSLQSLTAQNYTVTVGAGGAGGTYAGPPRGSQGANSQFGSLTASVGGGGGGGFNGSYFSPTTGGSGGGGTTDQPGGGAQTGAAGTSGQGNAGGSYTRDLNYAAGGGGGAGAVGGNSSGTTAGSGGIGSSTYSSWGLATTTGQNSSGTVYYAGGGGGGSNGSGSQSSGGLGGGGAGRVSFGQTPDNGTVNTGGGGGGGPTGSGSSAANGGAGGSGIVIVRYLVA